MKNVDAIQWLKKCIRWFCPYGILRIHRKILADRYYRWDKKANEIKNHFLSLNRDKQSIEILEIIDFFEEYKLFTYIPYIFIYRYYNKKVMTFLDSSSKMFFVLHQGKRMYFPRDWNKGHAAFYYKGLCLEQDAASPHRYETKEYIPREGDVIADIGAAEGVWALTYVEKVSKIYLFECEKHWIEALQKTFEPWKEKVIIVNKYVSISSGDGKISLDDFFQDKTINFIKADIEGAEVEMLKGSKAILTRTNDISLILCAYHKQDDAQVLKEILESVGFTTEYSNRYMLCTMDEIKAPYIRRGVIRARKKFINVICPFSKIL